MMLLQYNVRFGTSFMSKCSISSNFKYFSFFSYHNCVLYNVRVSPSDFVACCKPYFRFDMSPESAPWQTDLYLCGSVSGNSVRYTAHLCVCLFSERSANACRTATRPRKPRVTSWPRCIYRWLYQLIGGLQHVEPTQTPKLQKKKTVWSCGIFDLIWSQDRAAPPALTSGPSGFTVVILDPKTILLCFTADTLDFNY